MRSTASAIWTMAHAIVSGHITKPGACRAGSPSRRLAAPLMAKTAEASTASAVAQSLFGWINFTFLHLGQPPPLVRSGADLTAKADVSLGS